MPELMMTGDPGKDLPLLEVAARGGLFSAVVAALCESYTPGAAAALSAVLMWRLDEDAAEEMAHIFAARLGVSQSRSGRQRAMH
jgi:hypothetical protein